MSAGNLLDQLRAAWRTNNRINLFLLERISDPGLDCTLSKHGGRTVRRQLAHMHTNRVWQLDNRARDLADGLAKYTAKDEPSRDQLAAAFEASAARVETFFERCVTGQGKARGFKKGVIAHLGYFIAHESHHRGNILLTLKTSGHGLDKKDQYKIWDWDRF